jgi:hypothetical protein
MTEKPRPNADAPVVDSDLKVDVGWASGSRHSHERRTRVERTSCAQRTRPTECRSPRLLLQSESRKSSTESASIVALLTAGVLCAPGPRRA